MEPTKEAAEGYFKERKDASLNYLDRMEAEIMQLHLKNMVAYRVCSERYQETKKNEWLERMGQAKHDVDTGTAQLHHIRSLREEIREDKSVI